MLLFAAHNAPRRARVERSYIAQTREVATLAWKVQNALAVTDGIFKLTLALIACSLLCAVHNAPRRARARARGAFLYRPE